MEMLLMGVCLSVLGLAVMCVAFGAATRPEESQPAVAAEREIMMVPANPRFFVDDVTMPAAARARMPIEALLLQIENHVRLEHAAAESYLAMPTPAMLHGSTVSALIH